MTTEILLALITFAFVSSATPGPNNLMLIASGANYGFRRTLPHMFGISLGHAFMVTMVGIVLLDMFERFPVLNIVLKLLCVAYMLWLAWKIATALPPESKQVTGKPFTFLQAAAFQWVNPKAWSMALGAITLYAPGREFSAVLWVAGTYVLCALVSTTSWAAAGQQLRRLLTNRTRLRAFNWTMAAALIASMIPVILKDLGF